MHDFYHFHVIHTQFYVNGNTVRLKIYVYAYNWNGEMLFVGGGCNTSLFSRSISFALKTGVLKMCEESET